MTTRTEQLAWPTAVTAQIATGPGTRLRAYIPIRWLRECLERAAQRRELAALDDRLLRDIGVTRAQARAEASKPFWRS